MRSCRLLLILGLALAVSPSLVGAERPSVASNALFSNTATRPPIQTLTAPRIVENRMDIKYRTYLKNASVNWGDSPIASAQITWGSTVDGGQWFQTCTLAAGEQQVYATFTIGVFTNDDYIISFTVDSKSGTIGGGISGGLTGAPSATGTTTYTDPALGRHGLKFHVTSAPGVYTMRLGIGVGSANANDACIRYSNVMVERLPVNTRTYPYEYVNPADSRAFPYTYTNTMNGTLAGTPTLGTPYTIARNRSVLVIGDSMTDDKYSVPSGSSWGEFPWQMMRWDYRGRDVAIVSRGVAGAPISSITGQIATALAETTYTAGVAPWTICIAEGGTNDIINGRTLAQMQTDRLAQNAAIVAAGMYPILMTVPPYDAATAGQQTIMNDYNAWLKTLGYPTYDQYTDAADGSANHGAWWGSSDGIHPGQGYRTGSSIVGQRLTDLLTLLPD